VVFYSLSINQFIAAFFSSPAKCEVVMSKLIIEEKPLIVLPQLAVKIGLNEAIILQQLHYWLKDKGHDKEGEMWIYNTYEEWQTQFPFWSVSTIRRAIDSLEKKNLIETTSRFNKAKFDNTKWYRIKRETLQSLTISVTQDKQTSVQNEQTSVQNERTSVQNEQSKTVQNEQIEDSKMNRPIPESTQKKPKSTTETEVVSAKNAESDIPPPPIVNRKQNKERKPRDGLREVQLFFIEMGIDNPLANASEFFYHYETNGWVQGKRAKPIVDWKSAPFSSWKFKRNNSKLKVYLIDQYDNGYWQEFKREEIIRGLGSGRINIINDDYLECRYTREWKEEEPPEYPPISRNEIRSQIEQSLT